MLQFVQQQQRENAAALRDAADVFDLGRELDDTASSTLRSAIRTCRDALDSDAAVLGDFFNWAFADAR